ncbi:uncharacterized protein [Apostichopus japonicus]|uniref:uncharacterized protein isoform X2 n=1 Tax=Stichopus japonicus TaxID=307972 RepID=UPI003AB28068
MDAKTYFIQLSLYIRWLLFAFIVLLSVSLNESTEIITRSGTIGKIELNFNTSGHVPIVTWTLPHSTTFQHDLQVDNVVKTTEDYRSTVAEDGVFAALEIYNVNFLDAGTYTCRMDFSDTGRSSERAIEVLVIAFPSVSMRNDATENETISATCCINVSLAVEDTITWTINQSRSLQILQEVKTYFSAGVMKQLSSEIIFEVNRRYHRQLLRCSLRKPMNVYSEVAMNVQYPASIRYAEDGLHHISVYQFANVCCISEGNPRPSVELLWLSTEGYWNILTNVTEYVYHIEPFTYWTFMIHVAVRQLLQVRCVAINKIPPAATTQVLNVVAKYPASIRYAENSLLHLSVHQFANVCCISEGNPRPSVELQWLSTERDWENHANVTEYVYHKEPFTYWTFMIHVVVEQPLQVRCFAINEIPPAATTQVLNLVSKYPASVRMLSRSTTVPEGSDIIIECQSDGYPPPDTMLGMLSNTNGSEWAHLPIKAKMSNKSITTWKFELKSLAMNDSGKYQCVANNSEGYASSKNIEINVSLNENTEILTQFGTVGKIELNFDTSGHVPIVTWNLPQSTVFQHDSQVYNVVKTTVEYTSILFKKTACLLHWRFTMSTFLIQVHIPVVWIFWTQEDRQKDSFKFQLSIQPVYVC